MIRTARAASLALLGLLTVLAASSRAGEGPSILRVDPPSWWAADSDQTITLLVEGEGLEGARLTTDNSSVRVERVESGAQGRYLFVDLVIARGAEPGSVVLEIETQPRKLKRDWKLVKRPDYLPRGIDSDDVIYLIMPDRFANGDPSNDHPQAHDDLIDRKNPHAYHGGDFRGIKEHLPYLADLGVTALWLTPLYRPAPHWFEPRANGQRRRYADFHGYSPIDFYDANPWFGTLDEYRALVDEAHRLGLKIVQDQLLGFTGPQHHWVLHPPTADWFHGPIDKPPKLNFQFDALVNPHASEKDRRGIIDGWFFGILPDLNMRDPHVIRYAIQQSLWWTTLYSADGIRLDTYPMVDRSFWRDWHKRMKDTHPQITTVGEAWVSDAADLSFFQGGRAGWDGIDPGIELVFDFPLYGAIVDAIANKAGATKLAKALGRDGLYPRPDRLVTFLDNHDTSRLAALPNVTPARLQLASAFLLTTRGIPQLTWGDEIGLLGHSDDRRDFPGGFPGDARNAFTEAGRSADEQKTFLAYRELIRLRKQSPALRRGHLLDLISTDSVYAFLREQENERVLVILNFGAKRDRVSISSESLDAAGFERVYGEGSLTADAKNAVVDLPEESVAIFRARRN